MLRRLYRCGMRWGVRLHPSSFRRRFGEEMLYIFDQQKGAAAALGAMLDCFLSLLRQWTLRPRTGAQLRPAILQSSTTDHVPLFATFDTFQPRASAIIPGALLSLILFYAAVLAIPYSWIHIMDLRFFAEFAGDPTRPLSQPGSEHLRVDVLPTELAVLQSKTIASSSPHASAARARTTRVMIWLEPYVGIYISEHPPAKIAIQIENDPLRGDYLSFSTAAGGRPTLTLSPVSAKRFTIVGLKNRYVEFSADAQGTICCLSLVIDGNAISARRE